MGRKSRIETMRTLLLRALELGMCDFVNHGGPEPRGEVVMGHLKALMAKSDMCLDTPEAPLERNGFSNMVRIQRVGGNPVSPDWRVFRSQDWGKVDPNSTSQGDKINLVYRAAVENGLSLCETIANNAIGLQHMATRAFLLRTGFETHLPQVVPQRPLVANWNNSLSGKTLLTAVMDLGTLTFEDSIAVSESAAIAMTAYRTIRQTWVGSQKLKLLVKEGEYIAAKEPFAVTEDGTVTVHAKRLVYPSKLAKVEQTQVVRSGRLANRYRFTFIAEVRLHTGDKITARHGNKGIAWVIKDEAMPVVQDPRDPTRFTRVDVCISPGSVVKRRIMSLLWEMMLSKKATDLGVNYVLKAWDVPEEISFNSLVKDGYGKKSQLYLRGHRLEHQTFVGPLYWIRMDKLAAEQASAQEGKIHMSHLGLPVDTTLNGQRRDPSKSMAFFHRNLNDLLEYVIKDNTADTEKFEKLVRVLEPDFKIDLWERPNQTPALV
jgi:hypothetical protein